MEALNKMGSYRKGVEAVIARKRAGSGGGGFGSAVSISTLEDTSFSNTTFESPSFTPNAGSALVVVVGTHTATQPPRVTIGTASRTFGTGTTLTPTQTTASGDPNMAVYLIANALASANTIQVDNCGTPRCTYIRVIEIEGANATQSGNATDTDTFGSGSSSSLSMTVTAGSLVLYMSQHSYQGEDDVWSGATEIVDSSTGGTNQFQDFDYSIAYEVEGTTTAAASVSWTTSSNHQSIAIEIFAP